MGSTRRKGDHVCQIGIRIVKTIATMIARIIAMVDARITVPNVDVTGVAAATPARTVKLHHAIQKALIPAPITTRIMDAVMKATVTMASPAATASLKVLATPIMVRLPDVILNDTTTRQVIALANGTVAVMVAVTTVVANPVNAAGGIVPVMRLPRGLATKKPNDDAAGTNTAVVNIEATAREDTSVAMNVSGKTLTIV